MAKKAVYNKLVAWFADKKWNYIWDDNHNAFSWNVTIPNENEPLHFVLNLENDHYIVYGFAPAFVVSAETQNDALLFLNNINSTLIFGSFEMVAETSEIRFKLSVDCLKQTPSSEIIERSVFLPARMLMKYGDNIKDIISGRKNYNEVMSSIKKEG